MAETTRIFITYNALLNTYFLEQKATMTQELSASAVYINLLDAHSLDYCLLSCLLVPTNKPFGYRSVLFCIASLSRRKWTSAGFKSSPNGSYSVGISLPVFEIPGASVLDVSLAHTKCASLKKFYPRLVSFPIPTPCLMVNLYTVARASTSTIRESGRTHGG